MSEKAFIETFKSGLKKSMRIKDFQKYADMQLKTARANYRSGNWALNTLHNNFGMMRKAVKATFPAAKKINEIAFDLFRLSEDEITERNKKSSAVVTERHANQIIVDEEKLENMLVLGNQLLDSQTHGEICLGLIMLTGRRPMEIYSSARLDEMMVTGDQTIWFAGQAKQKTDSEAHNDAYEIPVLGDPEKILAGWKRIRELKPDLVGADSETVRKKAYTNLRKYFHKHVENGNFDYVTRAYDFRAMFAALSLRKFKKPTETEDHHIKSILGHAGDDFSTGLNYKHFQFMR